MSVSHQDDRDQQKLAKPRASEEAIVSSAHLVSEQAPGLSEIEYGLIITWNAFQRWIVRCMAATGVRDLGPLDVCVLHMVYHRKRAKRLSDICFILNVEDSHTVSYALRKLVKAGLVQPEREGKETFFSVTDSGADTCERYREVREQCLIESVGGLIDSPDELSNHARLLRALSGLYDQAARSATSL